MSFYWSTLEIIVIIKVVQKFLCSSYGFVWKITREMLYIKHERLTMENYNLNRYYKSYRNGLHSELCNAMDMFYKNLLNW